MTTTSPVAAELDALVTELAITTSLQRHAVDKFDLRDTMEEALDLSEFLLDCQDDWLDDFYDEATWEYSLTEEIRISKQIRKFYKQLKNTKN
jgi:hypothetical protein